jgi:hypothetical protein
VGPESFIDRSVTNSIFFIVVESLAGISHSTLFFP